MPSSKGFARTAIPALALLASLGACGSGQAARSSGPAAGVAKATVKGVRLIKLASLDEPVYLTGAPADAGRVFVVQRGGKVRLLLNGRVQARAFLDIGNLAYGGGTEQGLLGLALAPDYKTSGLLYVDYTDAHNNIEIVQYKRAAGNPDLADPASARVLLRIDHHAYSNHNGGQLAFGPDGDLYIGVGDGGNENDPDGNGQNTSTLLGKILRIAPTAGGSYTIPGGNPFAHQPGRRAEIWAYGLRNPWRFSFDRSSGALIVGDVGQDQQEEIDFAASGAGAGANYGWNVFEGKRRNKPGSAPGAVAPVLTASHSNGYCAIIGGYVVRDRSLPSLYGRYLFGDFCHPQIESVLLRNGHASGLRATGASVSGLSSLGQDARGRIYATSLSGSVYRLASR